MQYEWDEHKRLANVQKHGFDFADVPRVFEGDVLTIEDDRFEYDEQRFITIALLDGRVIVVVHTEPDDVTRIISVRKATKHEENRYFDYLAD